MLTQERYQIIMNLLEQKKAVTVSELTLALGASEATVRRDLNTLQEMGRLHKVHGGATALTGGITAGEPDMPTKSTLRMEEKSAIGAYAATLIEDDDFVYIDAGTTTEQLVQHLRPSKACFVTNGIDHAKLLIRRGLKTQLLGGTLKPTTEAIAGAVALEHLRQYNFSKCFLGANGVDLKCGFTTPDPEEAVLKTEAINRAYLSFVLADSGKFGLVTPVIFSPLRKACVLTEAEPAPEYRKQTVIKVVKEGTQV